MREHYWKILRLAEMLFNLQGVRNFANAIEQFLTADIESHFAEMEAATLVFKQNIPIRFVKNVNRKGSSYDLEIHSQWLTLYGDTKCKIQDREYSFTSFENSVDKARQQIPKNAPGFVCVKVPQSWMSPGIGEDFIPRIQPMLETKSRLVALLVHTHYFYDTDELTGGAIMQAVMLNEKSRYFDERVRTLWQRKRQRYWVDLNVFWGPTVRRAISVSDMRTP